MSLTCIEFLVKNAVVLKAAYIWSYGYRLHIFLAQQTEDQLYVLGLNSPIRHALTREDQCRDRGMWMSHVFSINIHQPSISISTPQSTVNSTRPQSISYLSVAVNLPLIYVSFCCWLQAWCDREEKKRKRKEVTSQKCYSLWANNSFSVVNSACIQLQTVCRLSTGGATDCFPFRSVYGYKWGPK